MIYESLNMYTIRVEQFALKALEFVRRSNHWSLKLEAQGPCTGHRSIIAILYCFSFKHIKREKGRDLTQYTNLCGLNTLPH